MNKSSLLAANRVNCLAQTARTPQLSNALWGPLSEEELSGEDPYLPLVTHWVWFHYDGAICAHIRGDDVISLASARLAQAANRAVEKDAILRGIQRPHGADGLPAPYLGFLANIDLLVQDQERRLTVKPSDRKPAEWQRITDAEERINTLISNLEFVDVTQFSQPGGLYLQISPQIAALAKESGLRQSHMRAAFGSGRSKTPKRPVDKTKFECLRFSLDAVMFS